MILTYQYRLLPSKAQHRALEIILESQRELYNAALEERIGAYRRGVKRTYVDQCAALTEWRKSDAEGASIPANLQRGTLKRVDEAYLGYYRRLKAKDGKAGFPRFRGKRRWHSFGFRQFSGIIFDGMRLRFRGMPSGIRVYLHRPLPQNARIRSCTFRRDAKGWKVGFAIDVPVQARDGDRGVGVDLGITVFAALSDGGFIPSLRAARRVDRRLRLLQRALARKRRESGARKEVQVQVARCRAEVARVRASFLHLASARLIRDYDVIAVEALNVGGLAQGRLARDIHDAAWGKFISMLRYKAERAGVHLIEVNPRNTSQDCSGCGTRVTKESHERRHDCPHCGLSLDRDLNAARNIWIRAGVGSGLRNVANHGKRAGGNLILKDVEIQTS